MTNLMITIYRKYWYGVHFVTLSSKNYLKNCCVLLPSITTLHLRTQEQVERAGFVDLPSLVLTFGILFLLDNKYKIRGWGYIQRQNVHTKIPENRSTVSRTKWQKIPSIETFSPLRKAYVRHCAKSSLLRNYCVPSVQCCKPNCTCRCPRSRRWTG